MKNPVKCAISPQSVSCQSCRETIFLPDFYFKVFKNHECIPCKMAMCLKSIQDGVAEHEKPVKCAISPQSVSCQSCQKTIFLPDFYVKVFKNYECIPCKMAMCLKSIQDGVAEHGKACQVCYLYPVRAVGK